tara:strand:- start:461 stop:628 length:168 start_codon:yes stop_codon:yes gene_type:complete
MNKEQIDDILCDLYDIQRQAMFHNFGLLPKDNEGTEFTINDCLENCVDILEQKIE